MKIRKPISTIKRPIVGIFIILICLIISVKAQSVNGTVNSFPDMYNVVLDTQSKDASGSMPVGGGDIGLNIWVENDQLLIYAQRSGIQDELNGFPKLGRLRLWTEPNIFLDAESFKQELKLSDGNIEITATHLKYGEIKQKVWVEVHKPVVHIETSSTKDLKHFTLYESWRIHSRALDPKSNLGARWGWWDVEGWPHEAILEPDSFVEEGSGMAFFHVNPDEKLTSKLAYDIMGLGEHYGKYFDPLKDLVLGGRISGDNWTFNGKYEGKYQSTDYSGWRYRTEKAVKEHQISMVLHTSRCGSGDEWISELKKIQATELNDSKLAWKKNQKWWSELWNRSHLILDPKHKLQQDTIWEMGRNYNLFRYMTACNAYGKNPTMFNGGLFTFDPELVKDHNSPFHPDWRRWGGGNYTLQNQCWVHWPMLKLGDKKHMEPLDYFMRSLKAAEMRVRHFYEHDGLLIPEASTVYGLPSPLHYGFDSTYIPYMRRMKWMDPALSKCDAVMHHHTATLEFSYMILEYYRYSGEDIAKWLPFVKSTIDFYDQHYRMQFASFGAGQELDPSGKLVLFPTSSTETHHFTTNSVPDVSGLRAVVNGIEELPKEWLDQFFEGRAKVNELYKTLPELHFELLDGDMVMPPARSTFYSHYPSPELYPNYPMFPFNQLKLGDKEMDYIHNTYKHWNTWQKMEAWEIFVSWTYGNVAFARMGITDKAVDLAQKKLSNGDYRFPAFWGPGYDWAPDHNWGGTGFVGVQEMLMQTIGDNILLLPTWPKNWDVEFKRHAPKSTIVEGKVIYGKLEQTKVIPESRMKDIEIYKKKV